MSPRWAIYSSKLYDRYCPPQISGNSFFVQKRKLVIILQSISWNDYKMLSIDVKVPLILTCVAIICPVVVCGFCGRIFARVAVLCLAEDSINVIQKHQTRISCSIRFATRWPAWLWNSLSISSQRGFVKFPEKRCFASLKCLFIYILQ